MEQTTVPLPVVTHVVPEPLDRVDEVVEPPEVVDELVEALDGVVEVVGAEVLVEEDWRAVPALPAHAGTAKSAATAAAVSPRRKILMGAGLSFRPVRLLRWTTKTRPWFRPLRVIAPNEGSATRNTRSAGLPIA